jgi:lysophospholipase L1-like esterase
MGDSITEGSDGGYREPLFETLLREVGLVNFVGRRSGQRDDPPRLIDHDHDGYSGYRIDELTSGDGFWGEGRPIEARLEDWEPAVVLLHIGTNDILQNYYLLGDPDLGIPNVVERLDSLVTRIAVAAPEVYVVVAQIVPITNNDEQDARVVAFNSRIPGLVARQQALGRRVSMVDMYTPLIPFPHPDGVHPSQEGYAEMAEVWYEELQALGLVPNPNPGRDDGVRLTDTFSARSPRPWPASASDLLDAGAPTLEDAVHTGYDGTTPLSVLNDGLAGDGTDDPDNTWTTVFILDTSVNAAGYDVTAIRSASGGPGPTYQQAYEVWWSSVDAPTVFHRLGDFHHVPVNVRERASGLLVEGEGEPLARGVKALEFRFASPPARQTGFIMLSDLTSYYEVEALGAPTPSEAAAAGSVVEGLPEHIALHATPNPFSSRATLSYDVPRPSAVRLAVYDALGREVAVLVDREVEAGRHAAVFDGSSLPSGTYLVRLKAAGTVRTRTLTLVR